MSLFDFARLTRLPNVFTAMADICLAWLIVDAGKEQVPVFLLVLLSSSCLYLAGMVWNDYFDVEQDKRERPNRPLASGRVGPSAAATLGTVLMVVGLTLAVSADWLRQGGGWRSSIVALLLVLAIFGYNGLFKRTWAGPITMGLCRFLNVMLGLTIVAGSPAAWGWMLAFVIGTYITGVTWFAWTEARVSNVQSLMGAAAIMLVGVLLSLVLPALLPRANLDESSLWWRGLGSGFFPYLLVLFIFIVAAPVLRAIADPEPARVQAAVKRTILGLVFLDAILATALVGPIGLSILVLLLPARILGRWVYST